MRLIAEELSCRRGERLLFAGLSFALGPGEALLVRGANGAGKSSLLRVLAGLLAASAGRVRSELPRGAEGHVGLHYLGHRDAAKPALTVRETAVFARALLGGAGGVDLALDRVGLLSLAHLPTGVLSAGQRRRLALARLLASPRPLWLLDEPNAALDAAGQGLLQDLIAEHRAGGGLVVAATHHDLLAPGARVLRLGTAA